MKLENFCVLNVNVVSCCVLLGAANGRANNREMCSGLLRLCVLLCVSGWVLFASCLCQVVSCLRLVVSRGPPPTGDIQ